jgi:hypothetical protein
MFDFIKLQVEAIKLLNKDRTRDRVRAWVDNMDVLFTPDGVRAYRIPATQFYLNTEKIQVLESLKNVMNTERGVEVQLTHMLLENGKDKLLTFAFTDGKRAYINEKHINTILPKNNAKHYYHFYMADYNAPLKVFEDDTCIAVFMPVVFKNQG